MLLFFLVSGSALYIDDIVPKEMQTRLAQAEKKSEEIESKRRSQMLLR